MFYNCLRIKYSIQQQEPMYIIIDKPTLSIKKHMHELPGKQITIYTNQLEKVSRDGIRKHLIASNKLSVFSKEYSVTNMSPIQKQKMQYTIYLRTAEIKPNFVVDLLLENDEDLTGFKVQFPVFLQLKCVKLEDTIYSLTRSLDLQKNFKILGKIGQGSFAQIYIAREMATEHLRAIKIINKQRCIRLGQLNFISNQVSVLKQVASPWQIGLYYVFQDSQNVYVIVQYCPYGDLYNEIAKKFSEMTVFTKYMYFIQISLGICRLHQRGYIYRDLKPQNVLIDYRGNAKLCDFGYSMKYKPGQLYNGLCGSYEYLPPEMVLKQGYNHTYDVYCLGLLFYEMMTGMNPFRGVSSKNMEEILHRKISFEVQGVLPSALDLMKRMLQADPKKRIGHESSADIFRHQFFMQNSDIVMKILKNQKLVSREPSESIIKNMVPRKQTKNQFMGGMLKSIPMIFTGKFYNYLSPEFDITEKMGPKMVPSDNKAVKNQQS